MHADTLWHSRAIGPTLARLALLPASGLYALGWTIYAGIYAIGLKRRQSAHHPIICVGNLVVGGIGKTPTTVYLARRLQQMGYGVTLGVSGYGGPHAEAATLAPDGPLSAKEWGDEPAMLREALPDIPMIVGRRRVLAAEIAHRETPTNVLLMDDGFQHLPLRPDIAILLDPTQPTNRFCLPAGPYREPRIFRRRADIVVAPDSGPFRLVRQPIQIEPAIPGEYAVLCALGQPDRFVQSIAEAVGRSALRTRLRPDHDPLDAGNLFDGIRDIPVVVTAKDAVKLKTRPDFGQYDIRIARYAVRIEPEIEFESWLRDRLAPFR